MANARIVSATTARDEEFSELAIHSGPELIPAIFGPRARNFWKRAFRHPACLFSFEHTRFIEVEGEPAGMALAYDWETKRRQERRSTLLMLRQLKWDFFRQMPVMRQSGEIMARITEGDFYLSNLAVYPRFRSLGYGARLMASIEESAIRSGSKRVVLDAEADKERTIQFYHRQGYRIEEELPTLKARNRDFRLFKLTKNLQL